MAPDEKFFIIGGHTNSNFVLCRRDFSGFETGGPFILVFMFF